MEAHFRDFIGIHKPFIADGYVPKRDEVMWMIENATLSGSLMPHMGLFVPTIMGQGSDEQQSWWLYRALNFEIVGGYAQTELGHGSNVRGLRTVAEYDVATQVCARGGGGWGHCPPPSAPSTLLMRCVLLVVPPSPTLPRTVSYTSLPHTFTHTHCSKAFCFSPQFSHGLDRVDGRAGGGAQGQSCICVKYVAFFFPFLAQSFGRSSC